jgi:hypothetical protein
LPQVQVRLLRFLPLPPRWGTVADSPSGIYLPHGQVFYLCIPDVCKFMHPERDSEITTGVDPILARYA